jgi:hypothetical protein
MTDKQRLCPECKKMLSYTRRCNRDLAEKQNRLCSSCRFSGENNPFYGKKHTEETKSKLRDRDMSAYKTPRFKAKMKAINNARGPQTKPVFTCWVERYGEAEALTRLAALREKHSKNNSGKGNPMYGKPSPQGSGNGWSGWYRGTYFRSLLELGYMVTELEGKNRTWVTTEEKKYRISYTDYLGNQRNYYPDFLVDNSYLVECKPKRLWATPKVEAKLKAATAFCATRGWTYQLIEPVKLSPEETKGLVDAGDLVWLPKYAEKWEKYYTKHLETSG